MATLDELRLQQLLGPFNRPQGIASLSQAASPLSFQYVDQLYPDSPPGSADEGYAIGPSGTADDLISTGFYGSPDIGFPFAPANRLQDLDLPRFQGVSELGRQDEDVEQVDYLPGQKKSFRDSATLEEYFQNRDPLSGIMKVLRSIPSPTNLLLNMLPEPDPRETNIRNFYGNQYGLTSTGSLASGIMAGYNPVFGSNFLNRLTGGRLPPRSFGLADAARRRIERIANRKRAQTEASRAKIAELQKFAERDTISRARFDNRNVYRDARDRGTLGPGGGFSTSGKEGAFSSKSGRGRKDF